MASWSSSWLQNTKIWLPTQKLKNRAKEPRKYFFFSFLQKYTTTATLLRDRTVRIALVTEVIGSGPRGRGNSINGITSAVPGSQRALTQW